MTVDLINHPPHYNSHPSGVECIEVTRCMTSGGGNAFKYVFRTELKDGRRDIEKSQFYLRDILSATDLPRSLQLYIPNRRSLARKLINQVLAAETDPVRQRFFRAIRDEKPRLALEAVEAMLAV